MPCSLSPVSNVFWSFPLRTLLNILPSPLAEAFVHTTLRTKKRIRHGSVQHLTQNEHVLLTIPPQPKAQTFQLEEVGHM